MRRKEQVCAGRRAQSARSGSVCREYTPSHAPRSSGPIPTHRMHPWVATNLPAPTCTNLHPTRTRPARGPSSAPYHQYGFGKAPRYGWVVRCGCGKDLVPPNRATSPPPSVQLDSRNLHPVPIAASALRHGLPRRQLGPDARRRRRQRPDPDPGRNRRARRRAARDVSAVLAPLQQLPEAC